jgi:hypothetical protein
VSKSGIIIIIIIIIIFVIIHSFCWFEELLVVTVSGIICFGFSISSVCVYSMLLFSLPGQSGPSPAAIQPAEAGRQLAGGH